jgi:hypothetical protein
MTRVPFDISAVICVFEPAVGIIRTTGLSHLGRPGLNLRESDEVVVRNLHCVIGNELRAGMTGNECRNLCARLADRMCRRGVCHRSVTDGYANNRQSNNKLTDNPHGFLQIESPVVALVAKLCTAVRPRTLDYRHAVGHVAVGHAQALMRVDVLPRPIEGSAQRPVGSLRQAGWSPVRRTPSAASNRRARLARRRCRCRRRVTRRDTRHCCRDCQRSYHCFLPIRT